MHRASDPSAVALILFLDWLAGAACTSALAVDQTSALPLVSSASPSELRDTLPTFPSILE